MQKLELQFSGSNQIQSLKLLNQLYNLMNSKYENLDKVVSEFRLIMNTYNQMSKSKKFDVWKCAFLICLGDRQNQLKSVLIASPDATITDYFNIATREQQLYSTSRDVKVTNHVARSNGRSKDNQESKRKKLECFECKKDHRLEDCHVYKEKVRKNPNYVLKELAEYRQRKRNRYLNYLRSTSVPSSSRYTESTSTQQNSNNDSIHLNCSIVNQAVIQNIGRLEKSTDIYLDSGASHHVFNSLENCFDIMSTKDTIYTASGQQMKVNHIAKRTIQTSPKSSLTINDALICEELYASFISVPKLDQSGMKTVFSEGKAEIYHGSRLVLVGIREEGAQLYKIHVNTQINSSSTEKFIANIMQTHRKYGHLSLKDMKSMKDVLKINIPNDYVLDCDTCRLSKFTRLPHNSSITNNATRPGEIIHTDHHIYHLKFFSQ